MLFKRKKKTTPRHLTGFNYPVVATDRPDKYYLELDGIRLVVEEGRIVGWYRPDTLDEND